MRSLILSLLVAIALSPFHSFSVAARVPAPDFTGTWKIDPKLSNAPALKDLDDLTFVISYNSPELRVVRLIKEPKKKERKSEVIYYTDGRGEKTSFLFGGDRFNSKTTWEGNIMVSKFPVSNYNPSTSAFDYRDYKDTWALTPDGLTLTVTTEIAVRNPSRNSGASQTYRKVFHKTT